MNLVKLLQEQVAANPDKICAAQLNPRDGSSKRSFTNWTLSEFYQQVQQVAKYLTSLGVKSGDSVAILANTRIEWLVADFAIMTLGGVSISIYQTLTSEEIAYLLYDSDAKIVFAENQIQIDKLNQALAEKVNIPAVEDRPAVSVDIQVAKIIAFEDVDTNDSIITFSEIAQKNDLVELGEVDISGASLASIVYTSGTTGVPKGVMQTHDNHLANLSQVKNSGVLAAGPSLFLFLPLAHSFAKLMAYLGLLTESSLKFPSIAPNTVKFKPESLVADMQGANANVFPIVPRILEKIEDKLSLKVGAGGVAGLLLNTTLKAAKKPNSFLYNITTPVRNKIKKGIFGDNFDFIVSGGAKLNKATNQFFDDLGICILQGYGLTETCVATNLNRKENNRLGTVGPVLDDTIQMRVVSDGEIQFKGPNVTNGYWKRPQATTESWATDGWFSTGDLGSIDQEGFLSITGRKKEIIVTSYGKKISPNPIEFKLAHSQYIDSAVMFGNDKPFCTAVLALNKNNLVRYCNQKDIVLSDKYQEQPEIIELVQDIVSQVNNKLASHEQIKKFVLITEDFTIENGLLTPTMKVKVKKVYERYQDLIESLYS